ncbi:hypothetical protein BG006_008683 [Podila minutissima]|uniref:Uncharacterized protein n=1 Tax=Podila minutissima TaxID=64525 RepID=A0A9P5SXS8_9FUNG|nr:hypothetical protein BG006_008683 [Podila minutissima]
MNSSSTSPIALDAPTEMGLTLTTPLATIPELASDAIEPTASEESAKDEEVAPHKSLQKHQRLSINMSLLSPSSSSSSLMSSSPPSASFSPSSPMSSAASSPSGHMRIGGFGSAGVSPILNPFQWTSDMRQYIMADIGPQPSNSQVPALRNQHLLVRQRSYSKIGPTCAGGLSPSTLHPSNGGCYFSRAKSGSVALSPTTAELERAQFHQGFLRRSSASDLCTIPQNATLPPILDSSRARGGCWNRGEEEM